LKAWIDGAVEPVRETLAIGFDPFDPHLVVVEVGDRPRRDHALHQPLMRPAGRQQRLVGGDRPADDRQVAAGLGILGQEGECVRAALDQHDAPASSGCGDDRAEVGRVEGDQSLVTAPPASQYSSMKPITCA
jgi:hypothetical protein